MVLFNRPRPNAQHSPQASKPHIKERIEELKKKNFKQGDSVIVGGGISGEFLRADFNTGDAIVLINKREQKVNPTNLERSSKTK